jgi:hypothetical protein
MKRTYSLKIGGEKFIIGFLTVVIAVVIPMFPEFFNTNLAELLVKLFPILKTATLGGLIIFAYNYLKFKTKK